jgi:hypothetical protein
MKNLINRIQIILLMTLAVTRAADSYAQPAGSDPGRFREGLMITTDRDIYIAGEQVWLKINKFNEAGERPSDFSKILYAELLNDANNPVVQLKLFSAGTSASGTIVLPDTLTSGNYLIRAYTKWMLNYPEKDFAYRTISVLNPFRSVDRLINPAQRAGKGKTDDSRKVQVAVDAPGTAATDEQVIGDIQFDKPEYSARQKIGIGVSLRDASGAPVAADLSLSVVKSTLKDNARERLASVPGREVTDGSPLADSVWLPEPEGEIISGTIRNKKTNEPLINADISLSVVGRSAVCQFGKTNNRGGFLFVVKDLSGPKEIVIQPFLHDESGCYVELNESFCSTFSDATPGKFYLDSIAAENINSAVISMQVNNLYKPFRQKGDTNKRAPDMKDFYGLPSRKLVLSDFIELTNIREVVKEIMPEVRVFRKYDKAWFKIVYDNPYQQFENQALVMVDGVPLNEIEGLLEMPSKDVERIDVISVRYFYGDFVFDGILSFITKKGNLNNLKFDESVFRQIYEGCQEPEKFYSPVYEIDSLRTSRIPDFRNTLHWDPQFRTGKDGKASAVLYASDEPGEYSAIIEGITSNGKRVRYARNFRIK